jgi:BNR repeat-like domain
MRRVMLLAAAVGLLALAISPAAGNAQERRTFGHAGDRSVDDDLIAARAGFLRGDEGPPILPSEIECEVVSGGRLNVKLDCDSILPNNEPDIEVNPADPLHMVASSNDFDSCCDGFYTSFDGGETWTQGNMSAEDARRIGSDPVTVFDVKHGTVIHTSLNFYPNGRDGDVVASISTDGGLTWNTVVEVGDGQGSDFDDVQVFNDKEWAVTDNDPDSPFYGRTYVTWSRFLFLNGAYAESPIWEAHSDDGGYTWSEPQEISGDHPLCTFQDQGPAGECDQDQGSVGTVGPDGTVSVVFWNEQNESSWEAGELFEEQIMVVRSHDGGETWTDPVHVEDMESGTRDYPTNVSGRRTLTGYQIRVNARGNIVADPVSGRLYVVFADNRRGVHDVANPVTNTNVYLMASDDGVVWHGPFVVSRERRDQWFPWVEVDPVTHRLGVIYHDRSYDPSGVGYGTTFAQGVVGHWNYQQVHTRLSDPVNSSFFQARVAGCKRCATFHGDYINVAYGSDGVAHLTWTDMSDRRPNGLSLQFIYYARRT